MRETRAVWKVRKGEIEFGRMVEGEYKSYNLLRLKEEWPMDCLLDELELDEFWPRS